MNWSHQVCLTDRPHQRLTEIDHVPSQRAERGLPAEPQEAEGAVHWGLEELLWPRNENFALL